MKLILSRKGFDSGVGNVPSPVLPGGMWSLPIPEAAGRNVACRYDNIRGDDETLGPLVRDLTRGRITPEQPAHLDPDLCRASLARAVGWRALFGQCGAAEAHLRAQGVGPGDLFLFFGWFRQAEYVNRCYRYVAAAPDLHMLFGWMQIAERIVLDECAAVPRWARYHPHCQRADFPRPNSLYVAAEQLQLPLQHAALSGAGVWRQPHSLLQLTAPDAARSLWQIPAWFHPRGRASALSYHARPDRWIAQGQHVLLRTVRRGQEFVLDCDDYPEALAWAAMLLRCATDG